MTEFEEILSELRKMSKVLLLANAKVIEGELVKVATTDDRKKMWVLIDGNRMPKEIADLVKVTQMAVSYFLSAAVTAGLVQYDRGKPPRRTLDYVPPAWIDLTKVPASIEVPQAPGQVTIDTQRQETPKEVQQ
jgi:hypothetical protein